MNQEVVSSSSPCPTVFCLCWTMGNPYSEPTEIEVKAEVYVYFLFCILTIIVGIKLGLQWFVFKDYYPLKEKSPILCILLIMSICGQLIIYPMVFISNYFTNIFVNGPSRLKFRSVQSGLEFSVFIIYLIRCLRIAYAHDTHSSRGKTVPFKIFQKQYLLAVFVGCLSLIKAFIVIVDSWNDQNSAAGNQIKDFALSVELQIPVTDENHLQTELDFIIRNIIAGFFWHCVLAYCMWLHKSVNERYSMKNELLLVLICDLFTSMFNIILLFYAVYNNYNPDSESFSKKPILEQYCEISSFYPVTEIIKLINLMLILFVSILQPLWSKKIYHVLLPTGRHYGFIKTMRDFLMEEQFLRVFTKYLQHSDKVSGNNTNMTLLDFWKKIMVIKLNRKEAEIDKLESIRILIEQVQGILFTDQNQLIINLKDSIIGLQQSITNSDIIKQKYRESINEKVDELEKIALERLDKIYMKNYSQTQSYHHLKKMTEEYKKVNLNMIMLNLALIVDSENEFA